MQTVLTVHEADTDAVLQWLGFVFAFGHRITNIDGSLICSHVDAFDVVDVDLAGQFIAASITGCVPTGWHGIDV